jgi:hypothetical protein
MRKNKLKIISYFSFFVALIIFKPLLAQRFTDSPYSRFGIGQIQQKSFAQANALGGSHIALKNDTLLPLFINVANPASYSSLLLTTFEAGVNSTFNKFSNSTTTFNSNNTSLVGNVVYSHICEDTGATDWNMAVYADDTNDAMIIKVAGEVSGTIDWKSEVILFSLS